MLEPHGVRAVFWLAFRVSLSVGQTAVDDFTRITIGHSMERVVETRDDS